MQYSCLKLCKKYFHLVFCIAVSMIFLVQVSSFLVWWLPEAAPRLAENVFVESVWYNSCMSSLPSFLCYQISCFHVLSYINASKIALILKEQKILIQSFLFRLVEKFLEFYMLVTGSFFLRWKR